MIFEEISAKMAKSTPEGKLGHTSWIKRYEPVSASVKRGRKIPAGSRNKIIYSTNKINTSGGRGDAFYF